MIEITPLLEPTAEQAPCGPSLEYDAAYQELERAVQGKPEQVIGDHVVPAVPPDWVAVRNQAAGLLGRSKDLRAAIWLTRALVRLDSLAGLASGLGLIEGLLTRYWDEVHPLPDREDNDLTIRLNTLASLADADGLLGDLRAANLVQASGHERISVRDAEAALGRLASSGGGPTLAQIEAAMQTPSGAEVLANIAQANESCNNIRKLLADKVGTELAPDLKPLATMLKGLLGLGGAVPGAEEATAQGEAEAGGAAGEGFDASRGIRSRNEAMRALDAVCDYFEKHEPTNPAPLLVRRAQRLMAMDFVAIIENLVPDSLSQIRNIAGLDKE